MTSRLGPLGEPLASSRDYAVCTQTVRLKADEPTEETMYSVVNTAFNVVEGRFASYPASLNALLQLQSQLNEAKVAAADKVTFHV